MTHEEELVWAAWKSQFEALMKDPDGRGLLSKFFDAFDKQCLRCLSDRAAELGLGLWEELLKLPDLHTRSFVHRYGEAVISRTPLPQHAVIKFEYTYDGSEKWLIALGIRYSDNDLWDLLLLGSDSTNYEGSPA